MMKAYKTIGTQSIGMSANDMEGDDKRHRAYGCPVVDVRPSRLERLISGILVQFFVGSSRVDLVENLGSRSPVTGPVSLKVPLFSETIDGAVVVVRSKSQRNKIGQHFFFSTKSFLLC